MPSPASPHAGHRLPAPPASQSTPAIRGRDTARCGPQTGDHLGRGRLVGPHDLPQVFGVELLGEPRRVGEVTEHDRQLPPFGLRACGSSQARTPLGRRRGVCRPGPGRESLSGLGGSRPDTVRGGRAGKLRVSAEGRVAGPATQAGARQTHCGRAATRGSPSRPARGPPRPWRGVAGFFPDVSSNASSRRRSGGGARGPPRCPWSTPITAGSRAWTRMLASAPGGVARGGAGAPVQTRPRASSTTGDA